MIFVEFVCVYNVNVIQCVCMCIYVYTYTCVCTFGVGQLTYVYSHECMWRLQCCNCCSYSCRRDLLRMYVCIYHFIVNITEKEFIITVRAGQYTHSIHQNIPFVSIPSRTSSLSFSCAHPISPLQSRS